VRIVGYADARAVTSLHPVDDKFFPARVYAPVEVDALVVDDLPVLIAEPVRFGVEVRAFVCERAVVGLSAYLRDGQLAQTDARAVLPVLRRACMPRGQLDAADAAWLRPRGAAARALSRSSAHSPGVAIGLR